MWHVRMALPNVRTHSTLGVDHSPPHIQVPTLVWRGRGGDVPREALWQVGALLGSMLCGAQSTRPFDGGPRASPNESEGMMASFEFVHASTPFSAERDQWSALEGCQES